MRHNFFNLDCFQVYLVRFVHVQENEDAYPANFSELDSSIFQNTEARRNIEHRSSFAKPKSMPAQSVVPTSISIGELLRAGKLVIPTRRQNKFLDLEEFDVVNQEWVGQKQLQFSVSVERFSSGGFRDAFKCIKLVCKEQDKHWVLKLYKESVKQTIQDQIGITIENHARKQVQMHEVARYITKKFKNTASKFSFGKTFNYNKVYYTNYNGEPATIEEFIPGVFVKYINNNGFCAEPSFASTEQDKETYNKAQTLVHYSYEATDQKMMLLDIQGSSFQVCDPEIATSALTMEDDTAENAKDEMLFCCGNLSIVAISNFIAEHQCNKYCKILGLKDLLDTL